MMATKISDLLLPVKKIGQLNSFPVIKAITELNRKFRVRVIALFTPSCSARWLPIFLLLSFLSNSKTWAQAWCPALYPSNSPAESKGIVEADFNGDGKPDLVTSHHNQLNGSPNQVSLLLNNGSGGFASGVLYPVGGRPVYMEVADFNGDGRPDLVTGHNRNQSTISVLLNNGSGGFAPRTDYAVLGNPKLAVGDFNGDGKTDIVVASESGPYVQMVLNNGSGGFVPQVAQQVDAGTCSDIAVADFNKDGMLDIVFGIQPSSFTTFMGLKVLMGMGDGFFTFSGFNPQKYPTNGTPFGFAVSDFNGDGNPDLAALNGNAVWVMPGNGQGNFGTKTEYAVGDGPNKIVVKDFNNDGKLDLVVANGTSQSVSVLPGNGAGSFGAKTDIQLSLPIGATDDLRISPLGLVVNDLNGDGKPDLATANSSAAEAFVMLNCAALPLQGFIFTAGPFKGCNPLTVNLSATGRNGTPPYSYSWVAPGAATVIGSINTATISTTFAVTSYDYFSVTVTDAEGRTSTDRLFTPVDIVPIRPAPVLIVDPVLVQCPESLTLVAGGGDFESVYVFTGPGIVSQNRNKIVVNAPGTYTVTFNADLYCPSDAPHTAEITITADQINSASLVNNGPISCTNPTVILTASQAAGALYAFSAGAVQIGGISGNTATVSAAGIYSVIVYHADGCEASAKTTVTGDATGNTPQTYYADQDKDGFGNINSPTTVCSSTPPAGYVTNNTDCNDGDAAVHEPQLYYVDNDRDGFGTTATALLCAATPPAGYATNNIDCNDNDATVHLPQQYFIDGDGDGYGSAATALVCASTAPEGYSANGTDCNDNDAAVHSPVLYFVDADRDGYGSSTTAMRCSATSPVGYSTNSTDCNDNDAAVHLPVQYYTDADKDGYGSSTTAMLCSSTAPVGYSVNNTDCNDNDASVHSPVLYYVDADRDGYGSTATAMLCSSIAPIGYSTNSTDCNDNNAMIHATVQFYIDADKDGYGSTATALQCSLTAPVGYSTNNTDCDDNDPTLNPATIPVINGLPSNINVSNNAGVCGAAVSWTAPTTLINCTGSSISQTAGPASGSVFPIGTTTVTYRVTDAALHTVSASFTITVNDTEKPVAIAKNVTIYLDANGNANVSPNTVNNGSTDNCSVLSVTLSKMNFTCANVGENVVTFTVNDIHGNSANGNATITVKDKMLPVAKCRNIEVYLDQNNTAIITPGQVDNSSTDNCGIQTLALSQTQFTAAGIYPVELTVTDANGNIAKCNATVTIIKRSVTLTYTGDYTEQYSDQQTLSATLKDDGSGNGVSGKTISFTIGSQTVTAVTNTSGVASTTLILTQNPDAAYTVATSFAGDGNYLAGSDNDAFFIKDEDARVNYTGLMFQATPAVSTSTATVVLQASLIDITAALGDAAYDAFAGDIRNARVRFINRDNNTYLSGWLTPALVSSADLKVGTVSASYTFNIGSADAAQFTIGIEVGTADGYYVRKSSDDNTVLTVYKPLGDFVTGGGYIIPTQSSGSYAATAGLKTNFGMNVKINKTGTNLKGSANIIFRRNVGAVIHTYQIKANAMTSLGVGGTSAVRKAQFLSKANLTDVTDPLNTITLGGNLDLRVDMTDKGEPGSTDSIGITLFNSLATLLYSSNWIVSKTVQKVLSAGNININSSSLSSLHTFTKTEAAKADAAAIKPSASGFDVKVMNNPTTTSFRLKLLSSNISAKFTLKLIDVTGRIVEIKENLHAGEVIELGADYFKGSYFAEVTQGEQRKVLKLIKMTSQ